MYTVENVTMGLKPISDASISLFRFRYYPVYRYNS